MIAALGAALFLAPAHVKGFYMSRARRSLSEHGQKGESGLSNLLTPTL